MVERVSTSSGRIGEMVSAPLGLRLSNEGGLTSFPVAENAEGAFDVDALGIFFWICL